MSPARSPRIPVQRLSSVKQRSVGKHAKQVSQQSKNAEAVAAAMSRFSGDSDDDDMEDSVAYDDTEAQNSYQSALQQGSTVSDAMSRALAIMRDKYAQDSPSPDSSSAESSPAHSRTTTPPASHLPFHADMMKQPVQPLSKHSPVRQHRRRNSDVTNSPTRDRVRLPMHVTSSLITPSRAQRSAAAREDRSPAWARQGHVDLDVSREEEDDELLFGRRRSNSSGSSSSNTATASAVASQHLDKVRMPAPTFRNRARSVSVDEPHQRQVIPTSSSSSSSSTSTSASSTLVRNFVSNIESVGSAADSDRQRNGRVYKFTSPKTKKLASRWD
jgi:hypothetical protein